MGLDYRGINIGWLCQRNSLNQLAGRRVGDIYGGRIGGAHADDLTRIDRPCAADLTDSYGNVRHNDPVPNRPRPPVSGIWLVGTVSRALALVVCAAEFIIQWDAQSTPPNPWPALLLVLAAFIGSAPTADRFRLMIVRTLEIALIAALLTRFPQDSPWVLPYVPVLVLGITLDLGIATALFARLTREQVAADYAAAHALLIELHSIAGNLTGGLDELTLAELTLESIITDLEPTRAVLLRLDAQRQPVRLAAFGDPAMDWPSNTAAWIDLMRHRRDPVYQSGGLDGTPGGAHVVLGLWIGERLTGLVLAEGRRAWSLGTISDAAELADEAAMRLESGFLFGEIRAIATVEERRRLAREIHDGVAQEIAALGFLVDDLTARSAAIDLTSDKGRQDVQNLHRDIRRLRSELTRVVSEFRLSIFDLRQDTAEATSLGEAITEHIRSLSSKSGLTVHLVLDEGPMRLSTEVEGELLRIAQEAITNVRRHAAAKNLWVTCQIEAPNAYLMLADDGIGMGVGRPDSYGLKIMKERAERIGGTISIGPRADSGTVVEVIVGDASAGATALPPTSIDLSPESQ